MKITATKLMISPLQRERSLALRAEHENGRFAAFTKSAAIVAVNYDHLISCFVWSAGQAWKTKFNCSF